MKYLAGTGSALLLQVAVTLAVIMMTSGGGSFVGLIAFISAIYGIPATLIVNLLLTRITSQKPMKTHVIRSLLVGLVLPVLQVGIFAAVKYFRL